MEFPIDDLFDEERSEQWVMAYFHPTGLTCPGCGRGTDAARRFRRTRRSRVTVYRCRQCHRVYNVYTGTIVQGQQLRPAQVILLVRGICNGEPSTVLATEVGISRTTVHTLRRAMQHNAQHRQPDTPLDDQYTETDEMFQHAGEKRNEARRPDRPPATAGQPTARTRDIRERPPADCGYGGPDEWAGTAPGGTAHQPRHPGSARDTLYRCAGGGLS
ncbi:transposase [Chloroflexus aurantiacus]